MNNKKKDDLRVRRTHKLLHDALLDLMEEQPFESITVKQICDKAMVHRTTFYTHFQDKYDLLSDSIKQIAEKELHFLNETLSPIESFKQILEAATKHRKLFSQLLSEETDSLRSVLRRDMGTGIRQYMVEHYSMEEDSIELHIAVESYIGAILGVLNWLLESNVSIDSEKIYSSMKFLKEWKSID